MAAKLVISETYNSSVVSLANGVIEVLQYPGERWQYFRVVGSPKLYTTLGGATHALNNEHALKSLQKKGV